MVKVKVCGITNLFDALSAVNSGCDALGFVFYKKSPRYIEPKKAAVIARSVPADIKKIGVFVDSSECQIKKIARGCRLDILQFHGSETPDFCRKFKNYKVIKAFRVKNKILPEDVNRYKVFAYLFDTFTIKEKGGSGKKFDWKLIRHLGKIRKPIFLSGGLNTCNVKNAIKLLKPKWVDVSSSVEERPGKKHHRKVQEFIKKAKGR